MLRESCTITAVINYRCYPVTPSRQQPKYALGASGLLGWVQITPPKKKSRIVPKCPKILIIKRRTSFPVRLKRNQTNSLCFVGAVCIYCIPESPMWLIRKRRTAEAFKIISAAAKKRGKDLDYENFIKVVEDGEGEEEVMGEGEEEVMGERKEKGDDGMVEGHETLLKREENLNLGNDKKDLDEAEEGDSPSYSPSSSSAPEIVSNLRKTSKGDSHLNPEGFRSALRSRIYLVSLLATGFIWSYNGFVYIGLTFTYGTLSGDRLFNFLLNQLIAIPAKCAGIALRFIYSGCYVNIILGFIPLVTKQ